MEDLSFLTRDWTCTTLHWMYGILTTRQPGNSSSGVHIKQKISEFLLPMHYFFHVAFPEVLGKNLPTHTPRDPNSLRSYWKANPPIFIRPWTIPAEFFRSNHASSYYSAYSYHSCMGFSRQEYWSGLPVPSPVDHVSSELSTMTHLFWVALHGLFHSIIGLHKAGSIWSFWLVFCDEERKWKPLSHVQLFVTRRTRQSMEFSRPEYCSRYPFPSSGIFQTQGSNLSLPHCR